MVFIYEILKIIFFTRFFKKSQFFEKKNYKILNDHLIVHKWIETFLDLRNILLIICTYHHVWAILLIISNLCINNIKIYLR